MNKVVINKHVIGEGRTYIIAELSANHGGSLSHAIEVIHAMKEAGADAIKLQTYTADTLTIKCDREEFRIGKGTLWEGRTLYDLYEEAHTPWDWHEKLFECANSLGLDCFSTPFDNTAVDFLETLNPPAYKIASFELVDLPLIQYVASKGRPIIMSTGMGSLSEVSEAVNAVKKVGVPLTLLKCTSAYPAPPETMNLRTIPHMSATFGVPVGLSDHTLGIAVPVAAVALGACVIEKHVTLSRKAPSPDSVFSLEPAEFKQMVDAVRFAELSLGSVKYEPAESEISSKAFRRSIYVVEDIEEGDTFTKENIRCIRPGYGISPKYYSLILNRIATRSLKRGTRLTWDAFTVTK